MWLGDTLIPPFSILFASACEKRSEGHRLGSSGRRLQRHMPTCLRRSGNLSFLSIASFSALLLSLFFPPFAFLLSVIFLKAAALEGCRFPVRRAIACSVFSFTHYLFRPFLPSQRERAKTAFHSCSFSLFHRFLLLSFHWLTRVLKFLDLHLIPCFVQCVHSTWLSYRCYCSRIPAFHPMNWRLRQLNTLFCQAFPSLFHFSQIPSRATLFARFFLKSPSQVSKLRAKTEYRCLCLWKSIFTSQSIGSGDSIVYLRK